MGAGLRTAIRREEAIAGPIAPPGATLPRSADAGCPFCNRHRRSTTPPRHRPGVEPERLAFIQHRMGELKARLAEGGVREAAIRSLVYVGLAEPGIDERAFNVV